MLNKRIATLLMGTMLIGSLAVGCGSSDGSGGQDSSKVTISGSTSVGPVVEILGEDFESKNEGISIEVQQIGSSAGIKNAIEGTSQIGMASRDLKDEEKASGLKETQIAIDGIAVITNKNNEVKDLTLEQVKDIYTGKIIDGKMVGIGKYNFIEGIEYVGEFNDNMKCGLGMCTFKSGNVYIGNFSDDTINGMGQMVYSSKDEYMGHWIDGKKYGLNHYLEDIYEDDSTIKDIGELSLNVDNLIGLLFDFEDEDEEIVISVVDFEHGGGLSNPRIREVDDSGDIENILKEFEELIGKQRVKLNE